MKLMNILPAALMLAPLTILAESISIERVEFSGPIALTQYAAIGDTAGLKGDAAPLKLKVDAKNLSYRPIRLDALPVNADGKTLNVIKADFENRHFTEAEIKIEGFDDYVAFVDGKELAGPKVKLHPATHTLTIKYVSAQNQSEAPKITIITKSDGLVSIVDDGMRMFTLDDVLYGKRITDAQISPTGSYMIVSYNDIAYGGRPNYYQRLYDVKNQRFVASIDGFARWMHNADRYVVERNDYENGRHLVAVNPSDGSEQIIARNIPDGYYRMSPTDDYLLYTLVREGEKEDPEIYQVLNPEDRQPGWRDRSYPAIYRFDDAVLQPLALGKEDIQTVDISADGKKALLLTKCLRMEKRPTTVFSLISLDLTSMKADTIVADDGFVSDAAYSPDGKQVAVIGSPEAFGRIGCVLPDNVVPSFYDNQLYVVNLDDHAVTPLTRDFDPSVNSFYWNPFDNLIYLITTERDMYTAYTIDPKKGEICPMPVPENVIKGLSAATMSPLVAVYGQSDSNPDALYIYNSKTKRSEIVDRPSAKRLENVKLGKCVDWTFDNSRGDTVYGRFYLPDNFDPSKKYPLIVNYYGGCSPSTRQFESRYPLHVYSSLGYVVLQLQPSGATGFGQEWSSRHVSTAGKGVAEDIIEGTKQFCKEMDFVDPDRIGCIGASYGGFMTQYLLTQTDLFATAISHAGISDHTSYWGEGYWGYSYSEVSMGEDLPWTNIDLYVKQSPLYNADKINTPLLLLHGDADHNVPVGESIQMFTALKRLGRDVALVQVADQDHHITADSKRKKWQDTIFAWFAKYLQDDDSWWREMYPVKSL